MSVKKAVKKSKAKKATTKRLSKETVLRLVSKASAAHPSHGKALLKSLSRLTADDKPAKKATKRRAVKSKRARKAATKKPFQKPTANLQAQFDEIVVRNANISAKRQPKLLGGLTVAERTHLAELIDQGRAPLLSETTGKVYGAFYVQDGVDKAGKRRPAFTVALVTVGEDLLGIGVAKVNPKDDVWDGGRGRMVALARAVRGEAKLV